MKEIIDLGQDIGYKYSSKDKSLIYWPNQKNYLIDDNNNIKYKKELLKLYNDSTFEQKVQFVKLNPQIIQNAICLTNQVVFEVTEKCNLSCAYCGLGDTYRIATEERCIEMDWQTAKTVLDYFIQKWKKEKPQNLKNLCYIGFYGGEPLLNMKLVKKIINYLEKHGKNLNFRYTMTTNGTLLPKYLKYLITKNFSLSISLDGNKKMNSYRVYKNGKEIYDDLYSNLKKIQKDYPIYFGENIEFLSVANNRNTDEGMLSYFNKEFGKRPQIHQVSSNMVADHNKWNSMRRKNEDFNKKDNKNHLIESLDFFSGNFYNHYRSLLDDSQMVKMPTGTCLPFSIRTFITARKNIIVCERIGFEHASGRVTSEGIDINFENIANFYNSILNKYKSLCESCYMNEACELCFYTDEHIFEENFECKDYYPVNRFRKNIVKSIQILKRNGDRPLTT